MPTFSVSESTATVTVAGDGASATLLVVNRVRVSPSSAQGTYTGTYNIKIDGTIKDSETAARLISGYSAGTAVLSASQVFATSYAGPTSATWQTNWASSADDADDVARTKSGTVTIPTRPPATPTAATAASAAYVSDARIDLSWTRPANAGAAATIWTDVLVQRQSAGATAWVTVATLAGTATTWSDTTTSANERYRYQVAGRNVSGTSAYVATGYVPTTPAAPTAVSAAKDAAGSIVVSWADNAAAETGYEVQDETTTLAASHPASPYTHTSPSTLTTHRYRVRALTDSTLVSAWSAYSNTVSLLSAPGAPDSLAPNGTAVAVESATVLTWSPVHPDSSPQSAYELQHRLAAGSWTGTGKVASATSAHTLTAGTYAAGSSVEWQVRTWGQHADAGAWSPVASYTVSATPTVTISAPAATIDSSVVAVAWSYYHAAGSPQAAYEVRIVDASTAAVYASTNGTGTATSWASPPAVPNDVTVDVQVRVRSAVGLWSAWSEVTWAVVYVPPLAPSLSAEWASGYGYVGLAAIATEDGVAPATVQIVVERSTDSGATWVEVVTGGVEVNVLDWMAPSAGTYHYRATAVSATPSSASVVVALSVPDTEANCVVWLGGGPGFARVVKLAWSPILGFTGGRQRALHAFAGRSVPVEFSALRSPRVVSVSATLMGDDDAESATRSELEDLFDLPGPHLYRDPLGRVLCGTLSELSWTREPGAGVTGLSFSVTQSAAPDSPQAAALAGYFAPHLAEVAPGVYVEV